MMNLFHCSAFSIDFIFVKLSTFRKWYFALYLYRLINGQVFLLHINNISFTYKLQEVFREYLKINGQKKKSFVL